MKLFAIALALPENETGFQLSIYFAIDETQEMAEQMAATHFASTMHKPQSFILETVEVPVDEEMIPKIAQKIKARMLLSGVVK